MHGLLNLSEAMKALVNDYKMRLVEARDSKLALHNINNKDLFYLLQILLDKNIPKNEAKQKAVQYSREHKVDKSVIMTVAGAANIKIDYNALAERGDVDMCTIFEETRLEGMMEGEIKGRAMEIVETGYEFNLSEEDILNRLQKKLNISIQAAQKYLKMFGKQVV